MVSFEQPLWTWAQTLSVLTGKRIQSLILTDRAPTTLSMILTVASCISICPQLSGVESGVGAMGTSCSGLRAGQKGAAVRGLVCACLWPSGCTCSICVCLHAWTQDPEGPVRNVRHGVLCGPYLVGAHEFPFWPCPRVYLLYHTWSQVFYGGVAGSLMAIAWFIITQEVLTPLFPRIAAW